MSSATPGQTDPAFSPDPPLILLAPMEGLLDATLRDVLTRAGGIDRCVSEFIRITDTLLPERAFVRVVPELLNGSRTRAGVPVRPQLLGSDPVCLAENAARLAGLAPEGIDLNFGCPARTVNQSRGGAVLLDEPELVGRIVSAVRRAVPAHVPVSAKMRLGYQDDLPRGGLRAGHRRRQGPASWWCTRARRHDGYRPPAYWERIARGAPGACTGGSAAAAGGQWRDLDGGGRAALPGGLGLSVTLMVGRGMVDAIRDWPWPSRSQGDVVPGRRCVPPLLLRRHAPRRREGKPARHCRQRRLALTPHPAALGSPLTHPHITTDYSESQLELITGVHATSRPAWTS
jgi:hypothetical protein